jgi:hypothetical protein
LSFGLLKDRLEPSYQDLDYIIDAHVRPAVSDDRFRYFEACGFKAKAIGHINRRVEQLDADYTNLLSLCVAEMRFHELSLKPYEGGYRYVPFYEALEFENLLSEGRALLDCFARAMGSVYGESPTTIDKLVRVLSARRESDKAGRVVDLLREAQKRLGGVVTDPGSREKRGMTDLVGHGERVDIFFTILPNRETGRYAVSHGALLNIRHAGATRFPHHRVVTIADKIWLLLLGLVEKCFQVQFPDKSPHEGAPPVPEREEQGRS